MKHGGDLGVAIEQFGGQVADWLDLSTGINPHAYPVTEDQHSHDWKSLPSQTELENLLGAARKAYSVPENLSVAAAPGTQLLLSLLPGVLPEGLTALAAPTYSSHRDVWTRHGRKPLELSSIYALPADARIVILVNPNNPDGQLIDVKSLLEIARSLRGRNGFLIIDEAFADVVPGASILPHLDEENVLVLRSFGKFFGLAGLRLGFLVGPQDITARISEILESWCVSGPALRIGAKALLDTGWQDRMVRQIADEMADLTLCLQENMLTVFGGTPLYALAGTRNAKALHEKLAERRIWTRIFDYAPTWIRFGLPGSAQNLERLANALSEIQREV